MRAELDTVELHDVEIGDILVAKDGSIHMIVTEEVTGRLKEANLSSGYVSYSHFVDVPTMVAYLGIEVVSILKNGKAIIKEEK